MASEINNLDNTGILLDLTYRVQRSDDDSFGELVLFVRGHDGKKRTLFIRDFFPYFYSSITEKQLKQLLRENSFFKKWFKSYKKAEKMRYDGGLPINLLRIEGKRPWEVPKIRKIFEMHGYDVFEADIPFTHRFLLDTGVFGLNGIQLSHRLPNKIGMTSISRIKPYSGEKFIRLKIVSMDIEVAVNEDPDRYSESLASVIREGKHRITAISFWFGNEINTGSGKIFVLKEDNDDSERELIIKAFEFLWEKIDPDVLITYNGDNFDIPYLLKRIEDLGIEKNILSPTKFFEPKKMLWGQGWNIPGILYYDIIKATKKIHTEDGSKSLDSVSRAVLGEGKLNLGTTHGEIWKKSLEDELVFKKFTAYALRDAELTYKLWFKLNLPEWIEVIRITGLPPGEGMYFTARQAGEFLLFRIMVQSGVLIPLAPGTEGKKKREKEHRSAQGGLVFEPKKEIASAVIISDFTSMYPSIIIAHNVGGESFLGIDSSEDPRKRFSKNPKTTMALMQEMIFSKRIKVKEQIKKISKSNKKEELEKLKAYSSALKIVANSTFGSYNFIGSRLYNPDIAGSITGIGRTYLKELEKKVAEFEKGYEVIYGDTDSVFIETPLKNKVEALWNTGPHSFEKIIDLLPEVKELLNFLGENLPSQMKLDLQDIAFRILFHKGVKKRYTYASIISKEIVIVGFEAIRSDWSPFARDAQKHSIKYILETGDLLLAKKEMITFISKIYEVKDEETLKKWLTVLGPIKKPPREYDSVTPAIAAFLHYCSVKKLDPDIVWREYDYFPYLIIKGKGLVRDRARHPSLVKIEDIDLSYYVKEAVRAVNRFNLKIKEEEIFKRKRINLDDFLFD